MWMMILAIDPTQIEIFHFFLLCTFSLKKSVFKEQLKVCQRAKFLNQIHVSMRLFYEMHIHSLYKHKNLILTFEVCETAFNWRTLWQVSDDQRRDAELVRQILTGDETAFDALYKRHTPRLYQFIVSKIDDRCDAEELVNDTFFKAWKHLHTLQEPEKVLNWMFRIARQLVAGWHRKHKKPDAMQGYTDVYEAEGEAAATAVIHQSTEEYTIETERWTAVSVAIAQLPKLERRMFRLRLAGKSYTEIAKRCKVTVSVVKNRLSRAKKRLKAWGIAWEAANAEGLDLEFSEFDKKKDKS